MKKVTLVLLMMAFGVMAVFAQEVKEGSAAMKSGNNNAFAIELKQTAKKDVEKSWTKFIKNYKGKAKFDKKSDFVFADDSEIKDMSSNTVDVYANVKQTGANTILTVWFDLGGAFLNSEMHGDKVPVAKEMLLNFAGTVSTAALEEEIKEEEKKLKDLQGDQKKLVKDKEGYEKEIEKCEQKIVEAKNSIAQNLEDQKSKETEIQSQMKVVNELLERLKKIKK